MRNLDQVRQSIYDQFQKEDYHVHVRRLNADKNKRLPTTGKPRIIDSGVPDEKEYYSLKPVKGSVMMFAAKKGDPILATLERAYASGDANTLKKMSADLEKEVAKRKVVSVKTVVDELIEAPAYYDLNYGMKTLAANVALVNGLSYGSMLLAWNGGKLQDADFHVVEYAKPGQTDDMELLLVKAKPNLSKIEMEALNAVPASQLGINIASAALSPAACLVIILVFALVTAAGNCSMFHDRLSEVSLPEATVKKLGKVTSAVELLSQRREVFESFGM